MIDPTLYKNMVYLLSYTPLMLGIGSYLCLSLLTFNTLGNFEYYKAKIILIICIILGILNIIKLKQV
jgi:hypothetical protein